MIALADPFQQGWDLGNLGWAFYEPNATFLAPGLVWTIQLAAVVGGHMLGAWAGHVVVALDSGAARGERSHSRREVPLALIMVALTTLTLWSLGQALVVEAPAAASSAEAASSTRIAAAGPGTTTGSAARIRVGRA